MPMCNASRRRRRAQTEAAGWHARAISVPDLRVQPIHPIDMAHIPLTNGNGPWIKFETRWQADSPKL